MQTLEDPPLLHTCFVWWAVHQLVPISPPRQTWGQGRERRKISNERGTQFTGCPKLGERILHGPQNLWFPFLTVGLLTQRAISGTAGQMGSSETGSQDYPSFFRKSECSALFLPFSGKWVEVSPELSSYYWVEWGHMEEKKGCEYLAEQVCPGHEGCIRSFKVSGLDKTYTLGCLAIFIISPLYPLRFKEAWAARCSDVFRG